jgi:hypothetical protein
MNYPLIAFILFAVIIGGVLWFLDYRHRFGPFEVRRSHEALWRKAFSDSDFHKVDLLLSEIMRVFMLSVDWRYRLRPSDDLHEIMDRQTKWSIDSLEGEELLMVGIDKFDTDFLPFFEKKPCRIRDLVGAVATVKK